MPPNQHPPPIVSFTPQGVREGLCHLASYERGYVRLGALKAIDQMLDRDLKRASGKANQSEPPPANPYDSFEYLPAASDSQAAQQAVAQQATETQPAEAETETEAADAKQQDQTNSEEDEDQSASQEDEPP